MAGLTGEEHAQQQPSGERATEDEERDSESDGDGAEEILEESPDKRWSKRREQVKQRDVPGIDVAYLAMDNETGNEVVWNEVQFSDRKNLKDKEVSQLARINAIFDDLMQLSHTNLVKFHKYWTDNKSDKPRIIFITEYMSSGSMFLFLQRTRKSGSSLSVKAWKKWATQILSALNYLHSSDPPIIHGNLCCNTIFIQQNGLIKIGCVAPDAINHHVKTCRDNLKNVHYMAPELDGSPNTVASDIFAFGVCALEIATCGALQCNGEQAIVTPEAMEKTLQTVEDIDQRQLIASCLARDPLHRPTARQLLFHKFLFEVHSLKLLSAHAIVDSKKYEDFTENVFRVPDAEKVAAVSKFREMAYHQVPAFQHDLEKYLEDVRSGIYPVSSFAPAAHVPIKLWAQQTGSWPCSESAGDGGGRETETASPSTERSPSPPPALPAEGVKSEPRLIVHMKATVEGPTLSLVLQLDDSMNRQLTTTIQPESDTAASLTHNLIQHGFICEADADKVSQLLDSILAVSRPSSHPSSVSPPPAAL